MRVHEWCHEVFHMSNAKVSLEICIPQDETWHSDVVFTRDVARGILHTMES